MKAASNQWGIIKFSSILWEVTHGNKSLAITAKTHRNLGDGGVYFECNRYCRINDYICGLRIEGEYRTNIPFKNEVHCKIRAIMEPLDKHPEVPYVEDTAHYEYYLDYKEVTREKYYHQEIENLCGQLLTNMDDYFSYRTFDKPDKAYHRIEDGGKTISMGIFTYWNVSHLGYGWYDLLKPGEDLFCNSRR